MPSTQQVVEEAAFADTVGRVVAAGGVFVQDARFQPRAILFVDPGQFQFLSAVGHGFIYADHAECRGADSGNADAYRAGKRSAPPKSAPLAIFIVVIILYNEWKRRILRI